MSASDIAIEMRETVAALRQNRGAWLSTVAATKIEGWADAILALHPPASDATVPPGFVLVPVEPTQAMISAACDMLEGRGNVINIWSAMLAVANEASNDGTR
jgi:hypothetical protein